MQNLIASVRERLRSRQYYNETAVREGIVVPILRELGWDTFDPAQVRPEHAVDSGRIDYALFHSSRQAAVFVEVKAIGRALGGDEQLFRYCFIQGVPLAVLTDGQTWNFYLPGGLGTIDQRRVYSLHLEERSAEEAERVLSRYLARERVCDGRAFSASREDHERALNQREAKSMLPAAWSELLNEENDGIVSILQDKVEAMCGYRTAANTTLDFLMSYSRAARSEPRTKNPAETPRPDRSSATAAGDRSVKYRIFGEPRHSANASRALVDILRHIVQADVRKLPELAEQVRGRTRCAIAQSPEEINPSRPDLARGEEIAPGWLVGLNIDNKEKQSIIEAACETYSLTMPNDIDVRLPNS